MRIDLHTHSSLSDGTDSPTRLVLNAQSKGLSTIALCDHDTFDGLAEADECARRVGLQVVDGLEMSARLFNITVHLLGYGCKTNNEELNMELAKVRASRRDRLPETLAKLGSLGMEITLEEVANHSSTGSVGRPHVADAMVARGYVVNRDEAFQKYLSEGGLAYVERYAVEVSRGIELIHGAGGVAVLAHPFIRSRGSTQITPEIIEEMAFDMHLDGIEVDHPSHSAHDRDLLHELGARLGLIRTGGSDYHGTGKIGHELGCETTRATALTELLRVIASRGGRA